MGWGDILSGVSEFWGNNKDWIQPLVKVGVGALKQSNTDNSQAEYLDYLKAQETANYQKKVDEINAYNAQLLATAAAGGGGGSGGGGGAGAANAAAAAAAARQTEKNRQKAAKKANNFLQQNYKELLAMYSPYKDTAAQLLPQMTQTYERSMGLQNSLASYLSNPAQMQKLDASIPAYQVKVPVPDSVRIK